MIYIYYLGFVKLMKSISLSSNIKMENQGIFKVKMIVSLKFKKFYLKFLYKLLFFCQKQVKFKDIKLLQKNWRVRFFKYNSLSYRFKLFTGELLNIDINLFRDLLGNFTKFGIFWNKVKNNILMKHKMNYQLDRSFFATVVQLNKYQQSLGILFKNLRVFTLGRKVQKKYIQYVIHINVKKNNIFLLFKCQELQKLIFFITAGRIFKGKKKRTYLTGRFLTKTFLRLIIRFLISKSNKSVKLERVLPYIFIIKYNFLLKHFLVKSILNSFKYYKFPIFSIENSSMLPHSIGMKLKKVRRL